METQESHPKRYGNHRRGGIFEPDFTAATVSELFLVVASELAVVVMKM